MPNAIGLMPTGVFRGDSCSRCARADNCYDTEVEIPYEGGIALCGGCIHDLAHACGLDVDGTKAAEAAARAELAEAELADVKGKLTKLRAALK